MQHTQKTLSPETVPETVSDNNFVAFASDDPYVFFLFLEGFVAFLKLIIYRLDDEEEEEVAVQHEKDNKTLAKKKTNNSRGCNVARPYKEAVWYSKVACDYGKRSDS